MQARRNDKHETSINQQLATINYLATHMYFFQFIYIIIRFGLRLVIVRRKAVKHATDYLHQIEEQFNGKFDEGTFKKVVKSHSVYLPIVNDAFTALHDRTTTLKEQERSIHYFICSSLFDNFWDDKTLNIDQLEQISFDTKRYPAKTFDEKVFVASHLFLLDEVKNKEAYLTIFRRTFNAQQASLEQFNAGITDNQITNITFEKGGNAVLLCSYYLDIDTSVTEENCWYYLGSIIQLSNDLFDIYKDINDGIQTLATRCTNAYAMETFFLQRLHLLKENIRLLEVSNSKKQSFSIAMAATAVLGLVAIEHLKEIQSSSDQLPDFKTLARQDLIVDMEKPKNILRWIKLLYVHAKM